MTTWNRVHFCPPQHCRRKGGSVAQVTSWFWSQEPGFKFLLGVNCTPRPQAKNLVSSSGPQFSRLQNGIMMMMMMMMMMVVICSKKKVLNLNEFEKCLT